MTCKHRVTCTAVRGDRVTLTCAGCGEVFDLGPASYSTGEPILDAAEKPEVRAAVKATAILGLLMAGVVCLHCEPSVALWIGGGLIAAGSALALVMLVRGDP